jgi:dTDP-4-dehydrorhamnose reductase
VTNPVVAVLGGSGLVGSRLLQLWADGYEVIAPSHAELDVLDAHALEAFISATPAESVINLAAWADVDGAEAERDNQSGRVYALNTAFPEQLAGLCRRRGKHLVHISTDYVFDGANSDRPYTEEDQPDPLSWYARTKFEGERAVLQSGASACVARIEMPFTGRDHPKRDFARLCAARLREGQIIRGVVDQRITPVFLDDALTALSLLLDARHTGIMHVAASNWTTPYQFAYSIADRLRLDSELVESEPFAQFAPTRPARRPQHPWLDVSRFARLIGEDVLRPVEAELDAWADQVLETARRT